MSALTICVIDTSLSSASSRFTTSLPKCAFITVPAPPSSRLAKLPALPGVAARFAYSLVCSPPTAFSASDHSLLLRIGVLYVPVDVDSRLSPPFALAGVVGVVGVPPRRRFLPNSLVLCAVFVALCDSRCCFHVIANCSNVSMRSIATLWRSRASSVFESCKSNITQQSARSFDVNDSARATDASASWATSFGTSKPCSSKRSRMSGGRAVVMARDGVWRSRGEAFENLKSEPSGVCERATTRRDAKRAESRSITSGRRPRPGRSFDASRRARRRRRRRRRRFRARLKTPGPC